MSIFDEIYSSDKWGFGSGNGSLPSLTKSYRHFIERFIHNNHITSVVDYGCGDWQFSKLIDWQGATYLGLDIVASVVENNTKLYGSDTVSFKHVTGNEKSLPKADLLIIKDVLQHMSEADIKQFLERHAHRYPYVLITNCVLPAKDINASIHTGEFRPLDLRQKPFKTAGTVVFEFDGPKSFSWTIRQSLPAWKKHVLLVTNNTNR
jgi:SAM-dependent methyltransferase